MKETFYLSNVVLQDLDNNGNYWNRLEIYCRDLASQFQVICATSFFGLYCYQAPSFLGCIRDIWASFPWLENEVVEPTLKDSMDSMLKPVKMLQLITYLICL